MATSTSSGGLNLRRLGLLAGLTLVLGVLLPGSALAAPGGGNLPVRGSHTGTETVNLLTGQGHAVTSGPISHFGLTTVEQDVQVVPTGPATSSFSGSWTLTAANGDQMFGTSTGTASTADGVHFTVVGHYVSSGGTGRFADASLTLDGMVQGIVLSVEGGISTDAVEAAIVGRLSY